METTQLESEFGEAFAEKNAHSESKVEENTNMHGNESGSEPEIYLLVSHRGRKHDHHSGRRIGLFGPFGPRGSKGFGFPFREGPHRGGHHPHDRPHDGVEMRGVRRGPPHARGFRHEPHVVRKPERNEEFVETREGERGHSPHRGMRRFGPGPHEKRGPPLERGSEFHREPRHHGDLNHRPHGFGPRGGSRGRFETEERVHTPHHHRLSREHGHRPRGGSRERLGNEERIHHLPREHGHGPHLRGHDIGHRGRFEVEVNVKQFHRRKSENHEHSPHRGLQSHRRGHRHHRRFRAEGSKKEFHGKHEHHGGHPVLENEHGRGGERGPHDDHPLRGHGHSPRGRFDKESEYFSDPSEHRGPRGHGFGPRHGQRFEHNRHVSDAEYKTRHHRGGHGFERARDGPESDYESEYSRKSSDHSGGHKFDNGSDFRGRRKLGRGGPRLHHHVPRHRILRGPCFPHRHHSKPLTPEELAEKVALLNSMGFSAENNSHYEDLLKKFNGRIGRVIDILLRERKKKEDDKNKETDGENGGNEEEDSGNEKEGDGNEEGDGENKKTPAEDFDIVE